MVKNVSLQDKKKKKKWLVILASKEFNNQEIGETYINEPEQALNRTIQINLMTLTRDPKKQNFNVFFKIKDVKNNQATTTLLAYKIQSAQLKKITKKNKAKVEDSYIYETKDKAKLIIKPILITKSLTYKNTLKEIRKLTRVFLDKYCKEHDVSEVMRDIVSGSLQREIKANAKKMIPMTNCLVKSAIIKQ